MLFKTFIAKISEITVKPQVAMDQDELAILKLISLCREDHSLYHPGLGDRREVAACISSRCRERWATMSKREKSPFIKMVSVGRVEKLTVPKNILVTGETLKSKRRKKFTPRFSGYLVFSKENRDKVMEELQAEGQLGGNCIQKMMREVERRWALLSLEEKAEYSSRARGLKEEHTLVKVEEIYESVDLKSHPLMQTKDKPHNCQQMVEKLTVPNNILVSGETLKSKRRKKFTRRNSSYPIFSKENRENVMEKAEYSSRNSCWEKEAMVVKVEESIEKSAGDLNSNHLVHIKDKPRGL